MLKTKREVPPVGFEPEIGVILIGSDTGGFCWKSFVNHSEATFSKLFRSWFPVGLVDKLQQHAVRESRTSQILFHKEISSAECSVESQTD
jgi:hypothetical protein